MLHLLHLLLLLPAAAAAPAAAAVPAAKAPAPAAKPAAPATPTPATPTPVAPAAAPPAPANIVSIMSKSGCAKFAGLLTSTPGAASTFQSAVDGGITAFCPSDDAVAGFADTFKNLTKDGQLSFLLYHAVPVYYSLLTLKTNNGVMTTLATDGAAKDFNFTVQSDGNAISVASAAASAAKIVSTVFDKEPVAVYKINHVLEPQELFAPADAPSPAPAPAADAPKPAGKKKPSGHKKAAPAPADGPTADDGAVADQKSAAGVTAAACRRVAAAAAAAVLAIVAL